MLRLTAILLVLTLTSSAQDCLTRKLFINISNKDWQRVSGIPADNIQGAYRGKPIKVLDLKTDYSPKRRVLLLLDTSSSMSSAPGRSGRQNTVLPLIVNKIVALLPLESSLAVGHFDTHIDLPARFENDPKKAIEILNAIMAQQRRFHGRTPLFAALRAASALFAPVQPGDSVIVITDASENASREVDKFAKEFELSGLRLFGFVVDDVYRSTPEEIEGPRRFSDLVEHTGGFVIFGPRNFGLDKASNQALDSAAAALVSRVLFMQELTIQLPEASPKPEKLKLRFSGLDPKHAKQLRIEYPAIIQPCEASTTASTQP